MFILAPQIPQGTKGEVAVVEGENLSKLSESAYPACARLAAKNVVDDNEVPVVAERRIAWGRP